MKNLKNIHAFSSDCLGTDDAIALKEKLDKKELSPVEVITASIERAKKIDIQLNAIATECYQLALDKAENSPNYSSDSTSFFSGLPFFIKDNHALKGVPVKYGSRAFSNKVAEKSSTLVEQFSLLGLNCIGKSVLSEFGLKPGTETNAHGITRNPWNNGFSAGGSSGGSAALVASGVVPIAHANDGGGSIRVPAACNGLIGLKPSRGRLKTESLFLPLNIVSEGIVSRTVRDTAGFFYAAENLYHNRELRSIGNITRPSKKRLRIGFFTDNPLNEPCHPEVINVVNNTATLCEQLGHSVTAIGSPFKAGVLEDFFIYWSFLSFMVKNFGQYLFEESFNKHLLENFTHNLADNFSQNFLKTPLVLINLLGFANEYQKAFSNFDLLLSPTLEKPPVELGHLGPEVDFNTIYERLVDYVTFTPYQNISGAPAISLPMGTSTEGLPIGVQFAAEMGGEKELLELAFEIEEASPWARIDH